MREPFGGRSRYLLTPQRFQVWSRNITTEPSETERWNISTEQGGSVGSFTGTAAVEASGLTKVFGTKHAVDGTDHSVLVGEIFGVLGPNGAGKTTYRSLVLQAGLTNQAVRFTRSGGL